jgi:hypothetical protein
MTTGWAAERLDRRWLGFEQQEYVEASRLRFYDDDRLMTDAELGARPEVGRAVPVG